MKKLLIIFLLFTTSCYAQVSNPPINITDGTANTYPYKLNVTAGSLTDNGDGTATLVTGGGGGGGDITDRVPYTGATSNVILGNYSLSSSGAIIGTNLQATTDATAPILYATNFVSSPVIRASSIYSSSNNYYVKNGGNDSADGLSDATAWSTLAKVSATAFNAGDTIHFKRGSTWREGLTVTNGNSTSHITYRDYGEGDKPIFLGSFDASHTPDWVDEGGNLWKTNTYVLLTYDIGNLIFANRSCGTKVATTPTVQGQFYWFWDSDHGAVEMYSTANPAASYTTVECAMRYATDGIIDLSNHNYIDIKNIDIRYVGNHGIVTSSSSYITISDCDISYCGGAYLTGTNRYGAGVQIGSNCNNIIVERCKTDNCYDAGLGIENSMDSATMENIYLRNNIINDCEYSFTTWNLGATCSTVNVHFENNTLTNAGSGWSHTQRPDPYGVHMIFWANNATTTVFEVRNNILDTAVRSGIYFYDDADMADYDINYNDYYVATTAVVESTAYFNLADWQTASSRDTNSIGDNPILLADYSVDSASKTIGSGIDLTGLVDYDYLNNKRTPPYDMGAYKAANYQTKLNGTGLVKASGSVITYDNSSYFSTASVVSSNGFAGTFSNSSSPTLTLSCSPNGVLKSNGTTISACSNLSDVTYLTSLSGAVLTDGTATGATAQTQIFTNGITSNGDMDENGQLEVRKANDCIIRGLTANSGSYGWLGLGRTTDELEIGVSAGGGQFSSDSTAGDIIYRSTTGNLLFQYGNGGKAIKIDTSNNITLGDTSANNITFAGNIYALSYASCPTVTCSVVNIGPAFKYSLPTTTGASGQVITLQTNGTSLWQTPSAGGGGYTNLTQFVAQNADKVFYSDGAGAVQELSLGGSGTYLKSQGAGSAPTWDTPSGSGASSGSILFCFDGGGSAIATDSVAWVYVPYSATITEWAIQAYATGSINCTVATNSFLALDVGKFSANNTISGTSGPKLVSQQRASDNIVSTTWQTAINNKWVACNVTSCDTTTQAVVWIGLTKS